MGLPRAHASHPAQLDVRKKLEATSAIWRSTLFVGTRFQLPHPSRLVSREREHLQLSCIHDRHAVVNPPYRPTTTSTVRRHYFASWRRAAREMARMMTPQEMTFGGVRNDVAVELVTLLLSGLHLRFAALEEESLLTSMTEMLSFSRRPNENISALLARYEAVLQRAAVEGQFVASVEGCALQLVSAACRPSTSSRCFNLTEDACR